MSDTVDSIHAYALISIANNNRRPFTPSTTTPQTSIIVSACEEGRVSTCWDSQNSKDAPNTLSPHVEVSSSYIYFYLHHTQRTHEHISTLQQRTQSGSHQTTTKRQHRICANPNERLSSVSSSFVIVTIQMSNAKHRHFGREERSFLALPPGESSIAVAPRYKLSHDTAAMLDMFKD